MLYRDTQILRATVTQEIRSILGPDVDGPEGSIREVQLLVPLEADVFATTEADASAKYGANRTYKLPPIPPAAQITFRLRKGQSLWAATKAGLAECALIIEYHRSDA